MPPGNFPPPPGGGTKKKTLQRKMTKGCYWIGAEENIGIFSQSRNYGNRFACLCLKDKLGLYLKDKLGLYLTNCHINTMTINCSTSMRVVTAMRGNQPQSLNPFDEYRCKYLLRIRDFVLSFELALIKCSRGY